MSENSNTVPAVVSLTIPCQAEYVGVARLAILGVASRLNFSYDDVEDLRLAVGEACTSAIDRATQNDRKDSPIQIVCEVAPDSLEVVVRYRLGRANGSDAGAGETQESDFGTTVDPENIGALLMEILVDSVEMNTSEDGETTVRLLKRVPPQ